jgi:hypothetical protein
MDDLFMRVCGVGMTARIEWRTKGAGDDGLLFVGDYGEADDTVLKAWDGDAAQIADFLNDMEGLDTVFTGLETDVDQRDPQQWGELVMVRSPEGDVLYINPERYWDAIYYWFRSHGNDPHNATRRG